MSTRKPHGPADADTFLARLDYSMLLVTTRAGAETGGWPVEHTAIGTSHC